VDKQNNYREKTIKSNRNKITKRQFLPYFTYLFTIQLTLLPYFPNLSTIQLIFLPYFPNHFTVQLTFLPYFPYEKGKLNSEKDMENTEEK
jgi:hypothetical protein